MACVKAVLQLESGKTRVFSENVGSGDGPTNLASTQKALTNIQKAVNDALTEIVNKERAAAAATEGDVVVPVDTGEEEEAEDDEDEDENPGHTVVDADGEPIQKRAKIDHEESSNGQSRDSIKLKDT